LSEPVTLQNERIATHIDVTLLRSDAVGSLTVKDVDRHRLQVNCQTIHLRFIA
jgi:hypothetical protein